MDRIFYPRSIVVIGVSEKPDNLARVILRNLRTFGYSGSLYAVGRETGEVLGVRILRSLEEVPDRLDLAVILTPAFLVPSLMETCGRKGILRVIIESGGFGEFSVEGRKVERQLVEIAARWGIRFVGPNCISAVNLETGLCLPFVSLEVEDMFLGPASVISQSGGVCVTYLTRLSTAGVGINKGISIGNKTNLNEEDYLEYMLADTGTQMVVLHLESVSDARRLLDLARSSSKPIIVQKANRGQASQAVALSHTSALASDDRIVEAALRQAGMLRAESFGEATAMAQALVLPPVRGNDLVIISRSGGHAVIAADAAERLGFRLVPLPDDFVTALRSIFRADVIAPTNPIDLGVVFDFELYAQVVEQCLTVLAPNAVLLINTYSTEEVEGAHQMARRVAEIMHARGCPVAFCAYSRGDDRERLQKETGLPVFVDLEDALRGLAASRERFAWRSRFQAGADTPPAQLPRGVFFPIEAPGPVTADRALELCAAYGIPVVAGRVAEGAEAAVLAAEQLGYPIALKALSPRVVHKSDAGGVALDLATSAAVREEATGMLTRLRAQPGAQSPARLLVQRMAGKGMEIVLGGKQDPTFGPVVMFGLGGLFVEVFDDVAFRLAPLTRAEAGSMIEEIKGRRLLAGARGREPADREALVEAIVAFSQLLAAHPELSEIEINPLIASRGGVVAVDARALAAPVAGPTHGKRREKASGRE